jgi:adenine-specific DNA-methyltransferase
MIYIDPPYNTGKDFVYKDDFHDSLENYKRITGQVDGNGKAISTNTETSGRYHTDWLNMMYPRLRLARNLLRDDGVIFISIDDNEVDNLRKIGDEVFGALNFIGQTVRVSSPTQNISKYISIMHDYTLIWCKDKNANNGDWKVKKNNADEFESRAKKLLARNLARTEIEAELRELVKYPRFYDFDHYTQCDSKGVFQLVSMGGVEKGNTSTQLIHPLTHKPCTMPQGGWRYKEDVLQQLVANDEIYYGKDESYIPRRKLYLHDYLYQIPKGINFFDTQTDIRFLKENKLPFDFPKPKDYIKYFVEMIGCTDDDIILDFFSGSSTTAHAVMQLNAEDGGNRKFIMVQLPEPTDEKSEAYKAGYKNICEIGKERIRRAGERIKEENKDKENIENLDIGFKVFKLDTSNIRKWQPDYDNLEQSLLDYVDNFVYGRTELDVVYEIMLKYGLDLTYPVDEFTIAQKKVYSIGFGMLMICLDDEITTEVARGILAKIKELSPESSRVVFKDNGFKSDSNKTNIKEILKSGGIEEFITI